MDKDIFSSYDIRGIVPDQWDKDDAVKLGQAFGTYFRNNEADTVYIGRDNRLSGPEIYPALVAGLKQTGCSVVKLGLITTPMTYFAWHHFQAPATIMVTASHNPPQYNGIKSACNKEIIYQDRLQEVKKILTSGQFSQGKGQVEEKDIVTPYIARLIENIQLQEELTIAIDTGNGTAGLFARQILEKAGCKVKMIFEESDGAFPNHEPYPQKEQLYEKLKDTLRKGDYDLGLAFDGDGDRLGIYSPSGEFIQNDITAGILARDVCQKNDQPKIVLNVSTTLGVLETIRKNGGEAILWKTGFPFIIQKMQEEEAIFGGEISGHFFFADRYYGYDDAFYAALRLLEIISRGQSINQLAKQVPQYHQIPEFRLTVPEGKDKYKLAKKMGENIKENYPKAEMLAIDGVRFAFEDGWGLIRPSNTEPVVSGRAEGKTTQALDNIRQIINEQLKKHNFAKTI